MKISNRFNSDLSWTFIVLLAWIFAGVILFPAWWRHFFFSGGILHVSFWLSGLQYILQYVFFGGSSLLTVLLLLLVLIVILPRFNQNLTLLKPPSINLFRGKKVFILGAFAILMGVVIYLAPSPLIDQKETQGAQDNQAKQSISDEFSAPMDFLFIDEKRIANLYDQVAPDTRLKESSIEKNKGASRQITGGLKDTLEGQNSESASEKTTEQFITKNISPPLKVAELLRYFKNKKAIDEFKTLELSSDELRKLDDFDQASKSYGIQYDRKKFESVYRDIIKKTLIDQQEKFKDLTHQLLIKGQFIMEHANNTILLSHDYFNRNNTTRIRFILEPIAEDSKFLISDSLRSKDNNAKPMALSVFGKMIRVDFQETELIVYCTPYAIW